MSEFARLPQEILRLIWEYLYAWQPLTLKIEIEPDFGDYFTIKFTTRTQLHVPCRDAWEVQRSSRPAVQQLETRYVRYPQVAAPIVVEPDVRTLYFPQGSKYISVFTTAFPTAGAASVAIRMELADYERLDLTELPNLPCLEEISLVSSATSPEHELREARDTCRENLRQTDEACQRVMEWPYVKSMAVTRHIPVNFRLEGCACDSSIAPASYCCIYCKPDAQVADIPANYYSFDRIHWVSSLCSQL